MMTQSEAIKILSFARSLSGICSKEPTMESYDLFIRFVIQPIFRDANKKKVLAGYEILDGHGFFTHLFAEKKIRFREKFKKAIESNGLNGDTFDEDIFSKVSRLCNYLRDGFWKFIAEGEKSIRSTLRLALNHKQFEYNKDLPVGAISQKKSQSEQDRKIYFLCQKNHWNVFEGDLDNEVSNSGIQYPPVSTSTLARRRKLSFLCLMPNGQVEGPYSELLLREKLNDGHIDEYTKTTEVLNFVSYSELALNQTGTVYYYRDSKNQLQGPVNDKEIGNCYSKTKITKATNIACVKEKGWVSCYEALSYCGIKNDGIPLPHPKDLRQCIIEIFKYLEKKIPFWCFLSWLEAEESPFKTHRTYDSKYESKTEVESGNLGQSNQGPTTDPNFHEFDYSEILQEAEFLFFKLKPKVQETFKRGYIWFKDKPIPYEELSKNLNKSSSTLQDHVEKFIKPNFLPLIKKYSHVPYIKREIIDHFRLKFSEHNPENANSDLFNKTEEL